VVGGGDGVEGGGDDVTSVVISGRDGEDNGTARRGAVDGRRAVRVGEPGILTTQT
jgi:hypothetical protein